MWTMWLANLQSWMNSGMTTKKKKKPKTKTKKNKLTSAVVSHPSSSSHSDVSDKAVSIFSRSLSVTISSPSSLESLSRVSNRKLSREFLACSLATLASSRALRFLSLKRKMASSRWESIVIVYTTRCASKTPSCLWATETSVNYQLFNLDLSIPTKMYNKNIIADCFSFVLGKLVCWWVTNWLQK